LARLSRISFLLLFALILAKMGAVILGVGGEFRLTYIALISALPMVTAKARVSSRSLGAILSVRAK